MVENPSLPPKVQILLFELQQAYETIKSTYNIITQFVTLTFTAQAALIGFAVENQNLYLILACGFISLFLLYEIYASNHTLSAALVTALSIEHQLGIAASQSMPTALVASMRGLPRLQKFQQIAATYPENFTHTWTSCRSQISVYSFGRSKTILVILVIALAELLSGIVLLLGGWWSG